MKTYPFKINTKELLADVLTPVAIYLKLRDVFPNSILLEGADFKAGENQYSFIGLEPVAGIKTSGRKVTLIFPDGTTHNQELTKMSEVTALLSQFAKVFVPENSPASLPATGLFGYATYESVTYFEDIELKTVAPDKQIPDLFYQFYKYIVAINHTSNKITLIEHLFNDEPSNLQFIEEQLLYRTFAIYRFQTINGEETNVTNQEYKQMVAKGKEHCLRGDLARNDLSRNADQVKFNYFREIHYYSHVLHMVSEVEGKIRSGTDPIRIFADTFPAGTLTGAPKYKAMELIDHYENQARGYYGGCIGNIGLNGKINQAITIRSFMSKNNTLYYQAGAGIVADSNEESELNEVNNKLAALKMAIEEAKKI